MSTDRGVADDRANALLKEQAVSSAEMRSACAMVADLALTATGWDEEAEASGRWDEAAAKAMTGQALEAIGAVPYEPGAQARTMRMRTDMSYRRPGQ